jgi:hypothetical protein
MVDTLSIDDLPCQELSFQVDKERPFS